MNKILLIGKDGQLGQALQRTLISQGEVIACGREQLDLLELTTLKAKVLALKPTIIINAAAYTAVEQAEQEKNKPLTINSLAPGILAEAANELGALFIHYSTDYVFDGKLQHPYREEDQPQPLNYYGYTKWQGEQAIVKQAGHYLIIRTSWLYSNQGKNFFLTILKLAQEKKELKIVVDQMGGPTWSDLIAVATAQLLAQNTKGKTGIYHLSCAGETSWYHFTQEILSHYPSLKPHLIPVTTAEYGAKLARPAYSVLSNQKINREFGIFLPNWQKALVDCIASR